LPKPIRWTEDAIVDAVHRFMARTGRPPVRTDFCAAKGLPDRQTIARSGLRHWQEPIRLALARTWPPEGD